MRRDSPNHGVEVSALLQALERGDPIVTTGLVLQELLQGFSGPKARELILERFSALPLLVPDRDDHVAAAEVRNSCRRSGLQIGTIDALIARLCIRHALTLLTTDQDFVAAAELVPLKLWRPVTR
jgi:predicted nucleic acid-binding protein